MLKILFGKNKNIYKGNFHVHSDNSDGKSTVDEIKKAYKEKGYSIVAFTDHDILLDHSNLNDENFLAITGMEYEFNEEKDLPFEFIKALHINLFAKDPHSKTYPCANPFYYWLPRKELIQDYYKGDFKREFTVESINTVIKEARNAGFLVSFNHPTWSLLSTTEFIGLEGLNFIELYNNETNKMGFLNESNEKDFDEFLRVGKRVFPFAVDDAHVKENFFGGWIMINADKLTYEDIFDSLEEGDFYASTGPSIESIIFDDETHEFIVKSKDAVTVGLSTERRHIAYRNKIEGSNEFRFDETWYINETLKYSDIKKAYVRFTLLNKVNHKAFSRAYFLDELLNKK